MKAYIVGVARCRGCGASVTLVRRLSTKHVAKNWPKTEGRCDACHAKTLGVTVWWPADPEVIEPVEQQRAIDKATNATTKWIQARGMN